MHESVHYLDAGGAAEIIYSKGEGVCALSCGDGFVSVLPTHPKASGRFSPILTHDVAGHVLTKIEPPFREAEADIYVARGHGAGGDSPVVTVLWFRVDVAKPRTDLRRVFARLRGRAIANASDACGEKGFVASGVYMESGLGVLAGRGRHSVEIKGKTRSLPYMRSCISDDEGLLAELMCGVAHVVGRADPAMVRGEHEVLIQRGHQYPRQLLHGDNFIKSHQVAIRACGGPNDPEGSDLHVDSMDGRGGAGGAWTVYAGGDAPSRFDRLAVFTSATAGNGFDVRVDGLGGDWACAVHVDTAHRLHGSIWPMEPIAGGGRPRVGAGLRIVTYTLRRIELLEEGILAAPEEEHVAIEASSQAVRRRMLGQCECIYKG